MATDTVFLPGQWMSDGEWGHGRLYMAPRAVRRANLVLSVAANAAQMVNMG